MSENASSSRKTKSKALSPCGCQVGALIGLLVFLLGISLGPIGGQPHWPQSASVQSVHAIGLAMYSYANDNDGEYPDGKNSVEVFQKLLDGGYVSDPAIFYVPAAGKTKATPGHKLKSENTCWDVTAGLTRTSPNEVPLLYLTGYRVDFRPGGAAVPVASPPAPDLTSRTWSEWWDGEPAPSSVFGAGIAVYYTNNSAKWIDTAVAPDGARSIPGFIPSTYKPDGKTYRQLTPGGVLAP